MGPIQSIEDFVAFLRRRATLLTLIIGVGCVLSVIYALRQPHVYQATSVVQIQTAKIADTLAPTTVATTPERRLQTVEQQVFARDNILALIEQHGLYAELDLTDLEKVTRFRELTRLNWIESADAVTLRDRLISGFNLSVQAGSPETAVAVTNQMIDQMVSLAKEGRLERTQTTLEFFIEREAVLTEEVEALQARIARLKAENELTISGGLEFRRIEISSLQEALLDIERGQLALQAELERLESGEQLRVTERRMEELRTEIANLESQRSVLRARMAALATELEALPEIEQEMSLLEERLARLQDQQAEALRNRADAETAHRLELSDQAERLVVIERAVPPDYPIGPGRKMLAAQGGVLSVVLAFGLAFLLELRRPAIRTAAQMEREVGLLPVVEIPHFASPHELTRPSPLRVALAGVTGVLVFALALVAFRASR